MANPFLELDSEDKAPETLKKALVSEINTIRGTTELVTLYVDHFFGAMGKVFSEFSIPTIDNTQKTPE